MKISLKKFDGKLSVLSCLRDDGSETWQSYGNQSDFFPIHDLTHLAIETELGYQHAFYGMIASGRDINDFGSGDSANLHVEAIHAEILAGLLTTTSGVGCGLSFPDLIVAINEKSAEYGAGEMCLTEIQLASIFSQVERLIGEWNATRPNQSLTLNF
jgi:hypothetical protein